MATTAPVWPATIVTGDVVISETRVYPSTCAAAVSSVTVQAVPSTNALEVQVASAAKVTVSGASSPQVTVKLYSAGAAAPASPATFLVRVNVPVLAV